MVFPAAPIREQLYKILFRPDKNAPEYKAVVEASRATHLAPLALLQKAGAIESAYQFHWQRFLFDNFPKGTGFGALAAAGEAGVKHLLELLEKEMRVAMTLTSVAKVADISADLLVREA